MATKNNDDDNDVSGDGDNDDSLLSPWEINQQTT